MKWHIQRFALASLIVTACVLKLHAQNPINATLSFSEYDVIYLTDFVDIKNQDLSPNISGISLTLTANGVDQQPLWVCVRVDVFVQLLGEANERLVTAYTNNFPVNGMKILAAKDFAKSAKSDIFIRNGSASYDENTTLRKRLEDMAAKNPTAPPGKYTVSMKVFSATSQDPNDSKLPDESRLLGSDSKTIVVQFSTTDQVFVEITEPKDGSILNTLAPTFNWTTGETNVRVSVYEVGINNRSPQDALTGGNPCLVKDLSGVTSLTYPGDAQRKLEQGKAYVAQVQAIITTNRGQVLRSSRPVVFRISEDKTGRILDQFMNALPGNEASAYTALRSDPTDWTPWAPYGNVTLNGNTVSDADLQALLNELASQQGVQVHVGIENQ